MDRYLGFQVGWLDVSDQPPLEAAAYTVFKFRQLFGRAVAGNDDLPLRFIKRVESMEELFLRALFLLQELDVIDEQQIHSTELVSEAGHLVIAQRVDHLVG